MAACGPEGDFRQLLERGAQIVAAAPTVHAFSGEHDGATGSEHATGHAAPAAAAGAGAAEGAVARVLGLVASPPPAPALQPPRVIAIPEGTTVVWTATPAAGFFQHYLQNVLPKVALASLFHPDILPPPPPPLPADAVITAPRKAGAAGAGSERTTIAEAAAEAEARDAVELRSKSRARPSPAASVLAIQELLPTRFALVPSLYAQFGWSVLDDRRNALQVRGPTSSVVYPCVAPPLHPFLWQTAQAAVLGLRPLPMERRTRIIYCGRTGVGKTENMGRRVLNEFELLPALRAAAAARGLALDVFDSSAFAGADAQALLDYWSTARLIIGPHGGALSNLVFAGCGTTVIELFPLAFGIKPPVGHAGMMMYMQVRQ